MPVSSLRSASPAEDLMEHPGHLIRRAQQVHEWLWRAQVSRTVTSPQFAVLNKLLAEPGIDQRTLGSSVALDRSTTAEVIRRLHQRHLVDRVEDATDRRRQLLRLTPAGARLVRELIPKARCMNDLLTQPLQPDERSELLRLLRAVVEAGAGPRRSE